MYKFLFILLFLPSILFAQLKQINDSTFTLTMTKAQMDVFFEKMTNYSILDSLVILYRQDLKNSERGLAAKDSVIKQDSIIISAKEKELVNAQAWITKENSTKVDFWQGFNGGIKIETKDEIDLKQLTSSSFHYSAFLDVGLRLGKFDFNPGINIFLDGKKPSYYLTAKYRIF